MSDAPPPQLVDTHAHIQDPAFEADRDAVVSRASATGVRAMVCVGYDPESSRRAVELAERHEMVYAAVGIHPNDSGRASDAHWTEVCRLARHEKVVGIGETGLDHYRDRTPPAVQEFWFERHLDLARETNLPVIVHNRQADARVRDILRTWELGLPGQHPRGVMHCFSADLTMLQASLELGFVISIAGPVTFKNADLLRTSARAVPANRLVVETDSPYLTPHPHRGQRNEPAYVVQTARFLAQIRNEPFARLAQLTTQTAANLFHLPISVQQGAETP